MIDEITWNAHGAAEATKLAQESANALERARLKALSEAGIPAKDMERIKAGALDPTPARDALPDEVIGAASSPPLICLSGNPGCGKTTAAGAWLAGYLWRDASWTTDSAYFDPTWKLRGRQPLFVKSARLSRWERYDTKQMDRLLLSSRLVIDDLGQEFNDVKGNFLSILDEVVDVRYDANRPLVVTTNLDADQFKLRYGARIADRIRESGRFVSLANQSLRGKLALVRSPGDSRAAP